MRKKIHRAEWQNGRNNSSLGILKEMERYKMFYTNFGGENITSKRTKKSVKYWPETDLLAMDCKTVSLLALVFQCPA